MTTRTRSGRAAHRARLSVQVLESREGPSSLLGSDGTDLSAQTPGSGSDGGTVTAPNQAPTISNFRAIVGPNGQVSFTGTVSDDQAVAGLVVTITGDGFSATAIVDEDGNFHTTTTVFGEGEMTATATVTDAQGATSSPVETTFTPEP